MNAVAHHIRPTPLPKRPAAPRVPHAVLVAAVGAVAAGLVLALPLLLGQRIWADGSLVDVARDVVHRYGATWVALGGVVLLGVRLVGRPARASSGRAAPAPVPPGRPHLRLVVSEDHR